MKIASVTPLVLSAPFETGSTGQGITRPGSYANHLEYARLRTTFSVRLAFLELESGSIVKTLLLGPSITLSSSMLVVLVLAGSLSAQLKHVTDHLSYVATQSDQRNTLEAVELNATADGFRLRKSGQSFTPWGFNYVGDFGRIVEEYWHEEWSRVENDFQEMCALGANVVRLHLQVGTYMVSPDKVNQQELKHLRRVLDLAQETGLYLDLTGLGCYHLDAVPAWYDQQAESERWQTQATFWEAIATTCAGHPAVFCYDLMNEPVVAPAKEGEHPWLLGELEGFYFVQRICGELGDRSRQQVAKAWVELLVKAIRKHDPEHLITLGVIPWALPFPSAKPLFYSPDIAQHLDFVSVHFYPEEGKIKDALEALAKYDIGQPLVIEEFFPLKCSLDQLDDFIDGERPSRWLDESLLWSHD